MTTYHCPECNQLWSMGPTRDVKEGVCAPCLQRQLDAAPFLDAILLAREVHQLREKCRELECDLNDARDNREALFQAFCKEEHEVCQHLGKALGYPWFKDDQKNFPGTTEADGVCVGEHVPCTLADEAATRIRLLNAGNNDLLHQLQETTEYYDIRLELIKNQAQYKYPTDVREEIMTICALGYIPAR